MSPVTNGSDDVHQHSGWWFPFAILAVIAVLSLAFLLYDLRPGPRSGMRTDDTSPVGLSLGNLALVVPANYLDSRAAREGGPQDTLTLSALLPDMRGYSAADAPLFQGNAPDSPLVRLYFKDDETEMSAAERLRRPPPGGLGRRWADGPVQRGPAVRPAPPARDSHRGGRPGDRGPGALG